MFFFHTIVTHVNRKKGGLSRKKIAYARGVKPKAYSCEGAGDQIYGWHLNQMNKYDQTHNTPTNTSSRN